MTNTDNIRVGATDTDNRTFQYLLAGLLLLAGLAMIMAVASSAVSADTLPPDITSDVMITGDQYFNDSSTNLSANIVVSSGGNLTLDNVTIDVVNNYITIEVDAGGRLAASNSEIMVDSGGYNIYLYQDGAMVLTKNTISGYSGFYLYTPDATIDGNTLTPMASYVDALYASYGWNSYSMDGPFITNNVFGDANSGIYIDGYGATLNKMVIKDNTFGYLYYYGIYLGLTSATTTEVDVINNNITYVSSNGIYASLEYGTFPKLNLDDNVIQDSSSTPIYIDAAWSYYSSSDWSISGNEIHGMSWYTGIDFEAYYSTLDNVTIDRNTIPDMGTAINFYNYYGGSNDISISGNMITNPNGNGINYYAYSANTNKLTMNGNTIENAQWSSPVYISNGYGSWQEFLFADNVIEHSWSNALGLDLYYMNAGDVAIINNTINDTGTFWYTYQVQYKNLVMNNNSFTHINGYVWYCDCYYQNIESITVKNNYASDNYYYFFYLYDYGGTITGDINIDHNTLKNQQYDYMFYIYVPRYQWSGGNGMQGWLNFTDNMLDTIFNWGQPAYISGESGSMKGLNVERNVIKDINGWGGLSLYFYSTTFTNDIRITNNTVVRCGSGIEFDGPSGTAPHLFVQNNTVINNQNNGIYVYFDGANYPFYFEGNLMIQNAWGASIDNWNPVNGAMYVDNNTFLKNQNGLELYGMKGVRLEDNKIISNTQNGVYISGDWQQQFEINSYNNDINNNGNDVYMEQGAIFKSHNDTFATSSLQNWGGASPEIWVFGSLDVRVLWLDGSGPVGDAELNIYDKDGNTVLEDRANSDGWYRNIDLILFKVLTTGKVMNVPVTVNATKYGIVSSVKVTPASHTLLTMYLDNVPPVVTVFSPTDMMMTNKDQVRVSGVTEPDAMFFINSVPINLTKAGAFEYYVPLTREGINDIRIVAKDRFNNTRNVLIHVIRDTVPPSLSVDQPANGAITNQPTITVQGETEPGAIVRVNDDIVAVDPNGRFEVKVMLTEGENNISIVATDAAGNEVHTNRIVNLDSVPPTITVITPPNGLVTNIGELDIRGMANGATSVKLNGIAVKLLGETFVTSQKLGPGVNTLLFEAWDDAGNYASLQISVIQDSNPPQLDVVYPKDNLFTSNSVLVVSGSSEVNNVVTVNGVQVTLDPNNGQFSYMVLLKEGANRIVIRAVDKIGNTYEVVRNVFLDTTPPPLTVTSPTEGLVTSDPKLVVEGMTDINSAITINELSVATEGGAFKKTMALKEGLNQIVIISTDLAGNRATIIRTVYLDTTAGIQIFAPGDGVRTTADNITVTGKIEAGSTLKINGMDVQADNQSQFSHNFPLSLGSNGFELVVTDAHGNVNTVERSVIREQVPPVKAKAQSTGLSGTSSWLAAALVGAIVGALMAIILFLAISRKKDGRETPVEEPSTVEVEAERPEPEAPKVPATRPVQPSPPAKNGNGIKLVPPPTSMVMKEDAKPKEPEPFSSADEEAPQPKSMSDKAAGGEIAATEGELTDLQKKVETLDAKGADTTKIKQSLRMAEIYNSKNNPGKAEKHIQKAKQMLTEMDTSSEIAPKGGEVELRSGSDKPPAEGYAPRKTTIPIIPPFPKLDTDAKPGDNKSKSGGEVE